VGIPSTAMIRCWASPTTHARRLPSGEYVRKQITPRRKRYPAHILIFLLNNEMTFIKKPIDKELDGPAVCAIAEAKQC
jgi:hypothetical protein